MKNEKKQNSLVLKKVIDVVIDNYEKYENKSFTGRAECMKKGIKFYFNKREHTFSSTELRQRVVDAEAEKLMRNLPKVDYESSNNN